jgi:hypothetical protein
MGYRGDDASRTWGDPRRQEPWRPSQGAPTSANGPRHADAQGYEPEGEYPSDDGYGVYEHGSRGYGQHGADPHGAAPGYGGYDDSGYGPSGGYGASGGYHSYDGYGDPNGRGDDGRGGSSGYQGQHGGSGGYSIPGDYGRQSGGYSPDDFSGRDPGGYERPAGGFPDNDWYGDSRAGGFADTTIHARPNIPDGYRPGDYDDGRRATGAAPDPSRADPRDAARGFPPARAALPAPPAIEPTPMDRLGQTRQQPVLDDSRYEAAYPGYENVDEQPGRGGFGTSGYPAQQGYDDYDDYADFTPDYEVPAPTTANPAYNEPAPTTGNPAYLEPETGYDEPAEFGAGPEGHDTTAVIDGYDDSFDGQGTMGDPGGRHDGPRQGASGKTGKASRAGKAAKNRKPRSRRKMAVLSVSAFCLVAVLGAVYYFMVRPSGDEATANAPLPSPGSTSSATAACVKQFGQYCHIEYRTDDPKALTISELFPPAVENTKDHTSFIRIGTRTDKTCSDALLGQSLVSAAQSGKCTQVLRASYTAGSGSSEIMGTIGVVNLNTTNQAHYAGKLVGTNDFIEPLATSSGVGANLGKSTGEMQSQFKGHYLILTWAELANEATPTNSDDQKLLQFENDLVADTANIALSQRMVSGQPGTGD